jgi:hypothetical protein
MQGYGIHTYLYKSQAFGFSTRGLEFISLHTDPAFENLDFKDFAQTWGWKIITVHEKMYL